MNDINKQDRPHTFVKMRFSNAACVPETAHVKVAVDPYTAEAFTMVVASSIAP